MDRFTLIKKLKGIAATYLLAFQLFIPETANAEGLTGQYQVTLAWNASPSPEVVAYRVHFGTTSGNYTGNLLVGNVTKSTVPGLENGVTYYFAISAISSTGEESEVSNEVSFLPGLHTTGLGAAATGERVLTIRGRIGQRYDIEATEDLITWTVISTVTMGDGGSMRFSDPDAANHPKRFYRTRESP